MREERARAICAQCPVLAECRQWARQHREYGFWGGESKRSAPRRASGSTCRWAGWPATRRATASPSSPGPPASPDPPRVASARWASPKGSTSTGVGEFLAANVASDTTGAPADAPLTAELIAGGKSNLTYELSDGTRSWVLRRPPLGHVLPTAHDMSREFRVQRALHGTGVPVPRVYAYCDDPDVIGAPFYVMEKVDGVVLRDPGAAAALTVDEAHGCSRELIDVLARIHAVDYREVGLGDFGRPDGFVERQVRRWGEQWERSKTRELPALDEVARRLRGAIPPSGAPAVVHGDYRLDNTMLAPGDPHPDRRRPRLGDGHHRRSPHRPRPLPRVLGRLPAQSVTMGTGAGPMSRFLGRDAVVEHYAHASGRSVEHLDFYEVLATYKLAVIVEGIHARFRMGKTLGEGFSTMGELVDQLAHAALEVADRSGVAALRG